MTGAGVALMRDVSILQMQGCIVHVVATFGRSRRVDVSAANNWSRGADAYAGTFSDAPGASLTGQTDTRPMYTTYRYMIRGRRNNIGI